MIQTK